MIDFDAPVCRCAVHQSPMGQMVSRWTDAGLYQLTWSDDLASSWDDSCQDSEQSTVLDDLLQIYYETGVADFGSIPVDGTGWTPFRRQVYGACRVIGHGETRTYGELASEVGSPGSARAVGAAMAANRTLLVIPCHRVIAASGRLQGFSGPGGLETKRWLLDRESSSTLF